MKLFLSILLSLSNIFGYCQQIDWSHAKNWKLYDLQNQKSLSLSRDSLSRFKSIDLNLDTIQNFLKEAILWPSEKYAVWMGNFVMTCEITGVMRKIDISMYGGFFYDESTKRYYEIPEDSRKEWLDYLTLKTDEFDNRR